MSMYYRGRDYEDLESSANISPDRALLGELWELARPFRHLLFIAFAVMIADAAVDLLRPYLMKVAVDRYMALKDIDGLADLFTLYIATIVASMALSYAETWILQYAGQQVIFEIRQRVFRFLTYQRQEDIETQPVGRMVTRVTNDTDAVKDLYTDVLVAFASDFVSLAGIIVVMLVIDWRLALASFSVVPVMVIVAASYQVFARKAYRTVREKTAALNSFIQENINGISVVKAFARFHRSGEEYRQNSKEYLDAGLKEMRTFAVFRPMVDLVYMAAVLLVLNYGNLQTVESGLEIGVIVAFLRYVEKFFWPIKDLAEKYNLLQSALAAAERIRPMLQDNREPEEEPRDKNEAFQGRIDFEDVWFAYEESVWVLAGVSFTVPAKHFFGVVGLSGSGKTTLISLLLRFYEPQKGRILLDGVDIREMSFTALRRRVAVVFQDVHIFKGTIEENLTLYDDSVSEGQIEQAVVASHADEFIRKLPDGYNTQVGYLGSMFSTGQRQILSFSRALIRHSDILVLDEATSSIDSQTEMLIQDALEKAAVQRTMLVVAHRLSTIQKADQIIVMHHGKITEQGTHEELIEQKGQYARLYWSQ